MLTFGRQDLVTPKDHFSRDSFLYLYLVGRLNIIMDIR